MNVEPNIQDALQRQSNLYNELMTRFYDPLQRALEPRNDQAIQNLRDQWTGGNPPEQDRFAMEIQSLRDISDEVANQELASGVTQLESMHEDITKDLQVQANQLNMILNGGRKKKRSATKRKRSQRGKSKKLRR